MKIQVVAAFNKYVLSSGLLVAFALLSNMASEAQTKRIVKSNKPFSVPCGTALRVGLDEVEKLYDQEQQRRYKDKTDSGTEGAALQNALSNYISCRRGDNAARLKNLTAFERTQINLMMENARRLVRLRVDSTPYISFDEKSEDPINYAVTYEAIALVEN